jgi:hypothetical protein
VIRAIYRLHLFTRATLAITGVVVLLASSLEVESPVPQLWLAVVGTIGVGVWTVALVPEILFPGLEVSAR